MRNFTAICPLRPHAFAHTWVTIWVKEQKIKFQFDVALWIRNSKMSTALSDFLLPYGYKTILRKLFCLNEIGLQQWLIRLTFLCLAARQKGNAPAVIEYADKAIRKPKAE